MEIHHDRDKCSFACIVDGLECSLQYQPKQTNTIVLDVYKTFVPPQLRGQKIAEKLVEAVINFAHGEHCLIHPSCSYVVTYFRRHKEYATLLDPTTDPENGGSCRI